MKAQIVSFRCVLRNRVGTVISSTYNQDVITSLGLKDAPLECLAEGLKDLKTGQKRRIALSAEKAFGFYDPELVLKFSRRAISHGTRLQMGDSIQIESEDGVRRTYRVTEADLRNVTLDGNHPLAGQDLVFDIEATDVRDATPQEIAESRGKELATLFH